MCSAGKQLSTAAIILYAARILLKFHLSLPADIDAAAANDDYDPKMDKPTPLIKRYLFTPRQRGGDAAAAPSFADNESESDRHVVGERPA